MALTNDKGQGLDEQIQAAKDFLWDHIEDRTRDFIIHISQLSEDKRKALYMNKVFCYLSAERKGEVIGKEIAILTLK